jgi:anaphase-promoting complex subunit 11
MTITRSCSGNPINHGLAILSTMKVTIKEWNAVASWRWDMPEDEVCGICRVQFDGTCPTCKFPGDDCSLCMSIPPDRELMAANECEVLGKCGHSFHMVR